MIYKEKKFNKVFHYTPIAIIVSLIIVILSISIVLQERNDVYQVAKQSVLNNAKLIGHDSEDVFIDAYKFLGSIGTYYENDILNEHKSIESFEQLVKKQIGYYPIIHHITTVNKDGNVVSSTSLNQNKSEEIENLSERKYFQEAKENKKEIIIYGPVQSIITGDWIVLVAKRLESNDESFAGILVAAINIKTFIQMYKNVDLGSNGAINLRKDDLSQVARYPELTGKDKGPGNKNISDTLANILKDNPNFEEVAFEAVSPLDDINKIYSIHKLDKIGMFLSVGRSTDDFGTTWKNTAWFLGIFSIFLSILIIVVAKKLDQQSEKLQEIVQEKVNALEIINHLREDFIQETNPFELYNNLRDTLIKITNSKEVFIGEISHNETQPSLKIYSLNESLLNDKIIQYSKKNDDWLNFIIENKEVFISNNSISETLMIVPIIFGEKIVGIVGFINKPKGYNKIDAEELNDILLALGQVIVARQDREQNYLIQKENLVQKKRIEHFIKYSSDGIHILDLNGNVIECSESFANLIGYTVQEVMNLNVKDWDASIPSVELISVIKEISNHKKIFETKYRKKDGSIIDVQINAVGLYLENTTYLFASARDITERKELINAIEDEKRFITTLVNSQEQFVITTDGIELKSANNSFLNFFNVKDIEEFVNRYGNCICDSFDKDDTNGFIQKNINGEDWIDYINARKELIHKAKIIKDNKTYIFSITVDKFLFKNELLYAAVFSDITQLENNIKINEETNFFLTQLLNSIPNPIFYKNEFGVFTGFNKAYEKTFNVKKEDLIGKTVLDLEYLPYEDRIMYHNEDMKIIENLSSVEKEQNMTFADNKIHTTLYFVNSYTKRDHSPGGLIGIFTDITEMKEKDRLIFEQAKLASMGEMIGNIAHQWRQPLSIISSISSGIKIMKEFDNLDNYNISPDMDKIIQQTEYLSRTIDDFRNYIKDSKELKELSIQNVLEKALLILHPAMVSNYIKIVKNISCDIEIDANENELMQAFINIINNAKDAIKENVQESDDRYIFISIYINEDNKKVLSISDTGGGISQNVINRVFEPYFTTKHQSVGTGLGLSMAYKIIVERYKFNLNVVNKEIYFNNKKYYGACFTIEF